jgi:fucose permease
MIWIAQAAGFILASFLNVHLTHRLGEGKVFFLGAICQTCGYALIPAALPFGVMVASYAVNGFGMALQDAQANTYVAGLPSAAQKLGVLHALYGVGALVRPLHTSSTRSPDLVAAHAPRGDGDDR